MNSDEEYHCSDTSLSPEEKQQQKQQYTIQQQLSKAEDDNEENTSSPTVPNRGYYTSLLQTRLRQDASAHHPIITLPPHIIGGVRDQLDRSRQCNCKRSHCLKLYCECFAAGIYCKEGFCNCIKCKNCMKFDNERAQQILHTLERNVTAFRPRAAACTTTTNVNNPSSTSNTEQNTTRGCNCRKSACLKKYCECFQNFMFCNPKICKCIGCSNVSGNKKREELIRKRQNQQELAAAQAMTYQAVNRNVNATSSVFPSMLDPFLPPMAHTIPAFSGSYSSLIAFGIPASSSSSSDVKFESTLNYDCMQPPTPANSKTLDEASKTDGAQKKPSSPTPSAERSSSPATTLEYDAKTTLERKWEKATNHVEQYFHEVQECIENKTHSENFGSELFSPFFAAHFVESKIQHHFKSIESIEECFHRGKSYDESQPTNSIEKINVARQDSSFQQNKPTDDPLICDEELPKMPNPILSDIARSELSLLFRQDHAVMKNLATTINDLAMEVSRLRRRRKRARIS